MAVKDSLEKLWKELDLKVHWHVEYQFVCLFVCFSDFPPLLTTESECKSSEEADGEIVTLTYFQHIKAFISAPAILSMIISVYYFWQGGRGGVSNVNLHRRLVIKQTHVKHYVTVLELYANLYVTETVSSLGKIK